MNRRLAIVISAVAVMAATSADAGEYYFRAGLGLDRPFETTFTDRDCSSKAPAALYGCGLGGDGVPFQARGELGAAPTLEAGFGYDAWNKARLEAVIAYRPSLDFSGTTNFLETGRQQSVTANLSSLSTMAVAYVDLPDLSLPKLGLLEPFVGAGVGIVRNRVSETRMTFPKTTTVVPGGVGTGLAWMVTVGVGTALDERTTLEFALRYTDFDTARTGRGKGRVNWRDGSREPLPLDLAETQAELRSYGVWLSVRYKF